MARIGETRVLNNATACRCFGGMLSATAYEASVKAAVGSERHERWARLTPAPFDAAWFKFIGLFLLVAIIGVGILSYQNATYDVDYDRFLENYSILGLPTTATVKEVRAAFRAQAPKWYAADTMHGFTNRLREY
jgi:hypothetical protein